MNPSRPRSHPRPHSTDTGWVGRERERHTTTTQFTQTVRDEKWERKKTLNPSRGNLFTLLNLCNDFRLLTRSSWSEVSVSRETSRISRQCGNQSVSGGLRLTSGTANHKSVPVGRPSRTLVYLKNTFTKFLRLYERIITTLTMDFQC